MAGQVGRIETAHGRLLLVVGLLVIATVVGMIALWPPTQQLPASDEGSAEELVTGEVVGVERETREVDPDTGVSGETLLIEVRLLDGSARGSVVDVEVPTEGFPEIEVGDRTAMGRSDDPDGGDQYYIADFQRTPTLLWLVGLFVGAVLVVSRWHGLRSLAGLGISLLIIVEFVVPAILAGADPPVVALVGSIAVMIVTLYLTHGLRAMTTAAVVGTSAALAVTVGLGLFFIEQGKITGFASEDAVFARFAVDGALDLQGLVLAGLIIAALGVLDDVTISQSSTVFALHETDPTLSWAALFARAMIVGRDHIASVVNTLFLAYAGASLALLVLFSTGGQGVGEIVNSEILAEEIVKTIVGSMGLILAVPFTTALAATVAVGRRQKTPATVDVVRPRSGPAGDAHHGSAVPPPPGEAEGESLDDEERAARAWAAYLRGRDGT